MTLFSLPKGISDRLTQRAKHVIARAAELGLGKIPQKTTVIQPIHLFCALHEEKGSLAKNILEAHGVNMLKVKEALTRIPGVEENGIAAKRQTRDLSEATKALIKKAAQTAAIHSQPYIGTEHLLYAFACQASPITYKSKNRITYALTKKQIMQLKKHLQTIFAQTIPFPTDIQKAFKQYVHDSLNFRTRENRRRTEKTRQKHNDQHHHAPSRETIRTSTPALDAFCENLTDLANQRVLDPVIGREKEMKRLIHILSRRTKNNPLLIGEPGVGKTAIVYGLAQKITNGEVPAGMLSREIFSLNLNTLLAGAMFRGDFEARIQGVLEEAARKRAIIFIDEIHTVIGAGAAQGSLDTANILKPALSQGALQCIGATTLDEYRKYLEKERALDRRFQIVMVEEETEQNSITTLKSVKKLYEKHHNILIEDDAIEAAVQLSARYIQDRFLPDKALDVLDEAASRARNNAAIMEHSKKIREFEKQREFIEKKKEKAILEENYRDAIVLKDKEEAAREESRRFLKNFPLFAYKPTLTRKDVEETVAELTGIAVEDMRDKENIVFLNKLEASLNNEIVGQKEAIAAVLDTIKRNQTGLRKPDRPAGSFLFLGPSGVGKTALAKALAANYTGKIIKLNMAEYAEPYTISRLIGSPPGYVGYGESGELTEKIRRHPYAVVLFDEIEKAHPQVHNLLLSVLEEGRLSDATGRSVSFRHAIIILTSNAGSNAEDASTRRIYGFFTAASREEGGLKKALTEEIKEFLRPELISRIDKIVRFKKLDKKAIREITIRAVERLKERVAPLNINVSESIINDISERAWQPEEGARLVQNVVEQMIEAPLAQHLLRNPNAQNINL